MHAAVLLTATNGLFVFVCCSGFFSKDKNKNNLCPSTGMDPRHIQNVITIYIFRLINQVISKANIIIYPDMLLFVAAFEFIPT